MKQQIEDIIKKNLPEKKRDPKEYSTYLHKEFIEKAKNAGFTDEQAEFLWIEIEDKAFIRNNFGGLF